MSDIYFTPMTPELLCSDIKKSLAFYVDLLGFKIQYERPESNFAVLERQGTRLMLDQYVQGNPNKWIAAPLEYPYGRGINFEIDTKNAVDLYQNIVNANYPIFLPIDENWYKANDVMLGCLEFIVLDPDGYMLRFSEDLGERPVE